MNNSHLNYCAVITYQANTGPFLHYFYYLNTKILVMVRERNRSHCSNPEHCCHGITVQVLPSLTPSLGRKSLCTHEQTCTLITANLEWTGHSITTQRSQGSWFVGAEPLQGAGVTSKSVAESHLEYSQPQSSAVNETPSLLPSAAPCSTAV